MNVIDRLKLKIVQYDITVQHMSHYGMETHPFTSGFKISLVGSYVISSTLGYFMPNPLYIYIY